MRIVLVNISSSWAYQLSSVSKGVIQIGILKHLFNKCERKPLAVENHIRMQIQSRHRIIITNFHILLPQDT